jgi:clan AA aspartic protease (TIGR02281 family)
MEIPELTWYYEIMRCGQMLALSCVFLCIAANARADVLRLKNGRSVRGIIKNDEGDAVVISIAGGSLTFPKNSIECIERSSTDENRQHRMQWASNAAQAIQDQGAGKKSAGIAFPDTPNRIYIGAVLNRSVSVTFLLDTGAPYITIRKGLARRLDIAPGDGPIVDVSLAGKTVKAIQTTLKSVDIGGFKKSDVPALILMQDAGLADMQDGLLGLSFLNQYNFKIDYASRQLVLEEKSRR